MSAAEDGHGHPGAGRGGGTRSKVCAETLLRLTVLSVPSVSLSTWTGLLPYQSEPGPGPSGERREAARTGSSSSVENVTSLVRMCCDRFS